MAEGGYINLHRKIRDHWVWQNSDHFKWWVDLIMLANHHPRKIYLNGELIIIDTGEHHTSEVKLAERWNADRKTIDRFLNLLEKDGMIFLTKNRKTGTTIKLSNYKAYQAFFDDDMDNGRDNREDISMDITFPCNAHKQVIKELEEPKEDIKDILCPAAPDTAPKSKRKSFIPPSVEEIAAYCRERANGIDAQYFCDYYAARGWVYTNGKKMVDWKAAVRTWECNNKDKGGANGSNKRFNGSNNEPSGDKAKRPRVGDVV